MSASTEAVSRYRKTKANDVIGCYGDNEADLVFREAKRTCEEQIREGREALRELLAIRTHSCQWNEDDYCSICGADGRA